MNFPGIQAPNEPQNPQNQGKPGALGKIDRLYLTPRFGRLLGSARCKPLQRLIMSAIDDGYRPPARTAATRPECLSVTPDRARVSFDHAR
jgi:hypothetical protein